MVERPPDREPTAHSFDTRDADQSERDRALLGRHAFRNSSSIIEREVTVRIRAMLMAATVLVTLFAAGAGTAAATAPKAGTVGPLAAVSYTVCFKTSNLVGADTDSSVEIQLVGSLSTSLRFIGPLNDPNRDDFEIGRTDCFGPFPLADLGAYRAVLVRFTERTDINDDSWHLSHVTVSAPGRATGVFPCHCWFVSDDTDTLRVA